METKRNWYGNTYLRQIDFRKRLIRHKEGNYIMIMGKIQQEDKIIINIYAPNIRKLSYIKQLLKKHKGEIDNNVITVGDLNVPLTSIYRSSIQKINKKTLALNDTLDWIDYIYVYVCVWGGGGGYSEHSAPKQPKIISFQIHIEHFPG